MPSARRLLSGRWAISASRILPKQNCETAVVVGNSRSSPRRPKRSSRNNRVRADFVRFLALGGDEQAPVHERGVQLSGAWLLGHLDLEAVRIGVPLLLEDCRIEAIEAGHCTLKVLSLRGSELLNGLIGDGLRCEGNMHLADGFHARGEVRLAGATICGNLNCRGARFEGDTEPVLSFHSAHITASVFLTDNFHASGAVSLIGAVIGRSLDCSDGRFESPTGAPLTCDRANIAGSVFMSSGFHATGTVRLTGAAIGSVLDCRDGHFESTHGHAFYCDSVRIGGGMFFRPLKQAPGYVDFSSTSASFLCDEMQSWTGRPGQLVLDGFTYERLVGTTTDAKARIAWLDLQWPDHLGEQFRPQPWEQLIAVLRTMGHAEDARTVAIAKQDRLRRAGKIVRGARTLHQLYGLLVSYGYRPLRLLAATAGVWLLCFLAYWAAANPAWFGAEYPSRSRRRPSRRPRPGPRLPQLHPAHLLRRRPPPGRRSRLQGRMAASRRRPGRQPIDLGPAAALPLLVRDRLRLGRRPAPRRRPRQPHQEGLTGLLGPSLLRAFAPSRETIGRKIQVADSRLKAQAKAKASSASRFAASSS